MSSQCYVVAAQCWSTDRRRKLIWINENLCFPCAKLESIQCARLDHQSRRVPIAGLMSATTVGLNVRAKLTEAFAKLCAMAIRVSASTNPCLRRHNKTVEIQVPTGRAISMRCASVGLPQCLALLQYEYANLRTFNNALTTRDDHKYNVYPTATVCTSSLHPTFRFSKAVVPYFLVLSSPCSSSLVFLYVNLLGTTPWLY